MNRREFLKATQGAFAVSMFPNEFRYMLFSPLPSEGYLLTHTERARREDASDRSVYAVRKATPGALILADEDMRHFRQWPVPFGPHGAVQNPTSKHLIAAAQKWGRFMAVADIRTSDAPQIIEAPRGLVFFGHVCFTPDGQNLLVVAVDYANFLGMVLYYDVKTMKLERRVPSYGLYPHDLQLDRQNARQIIVANSGWAPTQPESRLDSNSVAEPCLCWVNIENGTLEKRVPMESPNYLPGHFSQSSSGTIFSHGPAYKTDVGQSRYFPFAAFWDGKSPTSKIISGSWSQDYYGDCLNSIIDEENDRVWFSIPNSNRVLVVSMSDFSVAREISIDEPYALTMLKKKGKIIVIGEHDVAYSLESMKHLAEVEQFKEVVSPHSSPLI